MTATDTTPRRGSSAVGRATRKRSVRFIAATAVTTLASGAIVLAGGGTAGAATPPLAQSVGRFLDGSAGGMPIQKIVDLKDARATAPGTQSVQNPLDVTLLGQLNLPLTGALDFPTDPAVDVGVVNQVAVAKTSGRSFGAAGAVADDGGINLGDNNGGVFPTVATIDLSAAALPTAPGLPGLPGGGGASALGGIRANIGAVAANAQTQAGGAVTPAPQYKIAGLNLDLSSPALGAVLSALGDVLTPPATLPLPMPTACQFKAQLLAPLKLDNGAVIINPTNGEIQISVAKLLTELNLDINKLPANSDLVAYLLKYITDPKLLAKGLQSAINDLVNPLQDNFAKCLTALGLGALADFFKQGQAALNTLASSITKALGNAGGPNPLQPLADGLKNVIDIGINVESGPGIQPVQTDPALKYTTALDKTPNQATPVVKNQTLIRALEINVLNGGVVTALANAAVGPSSAPPAAPPTSAAPPTTAVPPTAIPTGVPAGAAGHGGSPVLPLVLLLLGLTLAGGGVVSYRMRGKFSR